MAPAERFFRVLSRNRSGVFSPNSPRVLLVANQFPPLIGGAPQVYEMLLRHAAPHLMVLAPSSHYETGQPLVGAEEFDRQFPGAVVRIPRLRPPATPPPRRPAEILRRLVAQDLRIRRAVWACVKGLIASWRPEVVCLGDLYTSAWLGLKLERRGLPVLFYIHGDEVSSWIQSRLLAWETRRALTRASGFVAVSTFARDQLILRGAPPERVWLVPNGVDSAYFKPGPPSPEFVRRYRRPNERIILTLSRLTERKGVDTVLRALPIILERGIRVRYLIVGDGPYRPQLEALTKELRVGHVVEFCDAVKPDSQAKLQYYRLCDVFAMPNRTLATGEAEGFGLVFLEANACGKPVVGGHSGGVPDVIVHGQTGLLVDGNSVEDTARALVHLLENPQLADEMGRRGRAWAEQFPWKRTAEAFLEACRRVLRPRETQNYEA